jgi:hypothetical protein
MNFFDLNLKIKSDLKRGGESSFSCDDLPKQIQDFLSRYGSLGAEMGGLEFIVVDGTLILENKEAYALYYDGNDEEPTVEVEKDGMTIKVKMRSWGRTVLISAGVADDEPLFFSTVVHEIAHCIDGQSEGEDFARELEFILLTDVFGYSEDAAYQFLERKYR